MTEEEMITIPLKTYQELRQFVQNIAWVPKEDPDALDAYNWWIHDCETAQAICARNDWDYVDERDRHDTGDVPRRLTP